MSAALLAGLPNPVSAVSNALGGAASSAADGAFEVFMRRLVGGLAHAATTVVGQVTHYLGASSSVSLTDGWFAGPRARDITTTVALFAAALLLLFLLLAVVHGLARGDVGLMVRAAAIEVPLSVLGMAVLTTVTGVLLAATDGASSMVLSTVPESLDRFLDFGNPGSIRTLGLFGVVLVPAFILSAVAVWMELVVRSSLIYLLIAFSPVVLAARVWPALAGAWHQLCRIGVALIVSKFAIALALGLGAAAMGGGGPGNLGAAGPNPNDVGTQVGLSVGALVVGVSLMVLAALAPFVVLKLLPVFEAAVVAQGISRGPLRAAQTTAQTAYYAQGLRRLAGAHGRGSSSAGGGSGGPPDPGTSPGGGGAPAGRGGGGTLAGGGPGAAAGTGGSAAVASGSAAAAPAAAVAMVPVGLAGAVRGKGERLASLAGGAAT